MKQLRKKCIIIGLLFIISMERAICAGFKVKYKQDRKKEIFRPYDIEVSPRNNSPSIETSKSISNTLFLRTMLENRNCTSPVMSSRPMQIDNQALDISNPIKRLHIKENNTACSSNTKRVHYMGVDDAVTYITPESIIDLTSIITSELTPSTTINPLKIDSNSGLVITSALYFCDAKNQFIIRNYTSYIENFECALVSNTNGQLKCEKINQRANIIIENWKSDKETDIWTMIKSESMNFLLLKMVFKRIKEEKLLNISSLPNPLYYNRFLDDLVDYIKNHGQIIIYWSNNITSLRVNNRIETLGNIWINKEVNLYCCCSGIDRQMVIEGEEKDIQLKKKLNAILLIPEIYEDFYKMPESVVDNFVEQIKTEIMDRDKKNKNNNIVGSADDLKIEQLPDLKCIITYLIHTAQKDEALAEESYKKIKQIKLYKNSENLIEDSNAIEVYNFVCKAVSIFYKYHGMTYNLTIKQKEAIINRTRLIHINNMHENRSYNKLLGADSLWAQDLFKSIAKIKNIDKIESNGLIRSINIDNIGYIVMFSKNTPLLSIKDHYHVQFVDNEWHTITMIHLPYYIHRKKNGTIINYPFHTIKDIMNYLKQVFDIGDNRKDGKFGAVHPFKYSREDGTWSLITEKSDLNKTIMSIENENCNVVFYYIKQNIYKTEFCLAQFVYSSEVKNNVKDDNMDKTRIPLFLSRFMVSSAVLGPYDKNSINYSVFRLGKYKDLIPINYTEIYTPPPFKTNSNSSNSQTDDSISSIIERHIKESDLNYAIKHYYSDFFIRNSTDFYEDPHCYCMNIQQEIDENDSNVCITWNTRIYESVYEYTTYKFDSKIRDERTRVGVINKPAHASFIEMLQRKNPSLNTALYGHCFYKNRAEIDYKTSSIFCLTMKDLLKKLNAYLININAKDKIMDRISGAILNKKDYNPKFILKDISNAIKNSKLQEIRQSAKGILSIRDNNYNGCKYGFHYDILSALVKTNSITQESRLQQLINYQKSLKMTLNPKKSRKS
ncbi:hypothetical protein NEIRO03_0060 [Nematocida sp. AWRm78]|nr:hypothetical protein NEIRO02_0125 [Nematocida sp. AWRm79]KAI5182376.1 hypothetical protein NEIRO03_0060 [Nematocida sp. AWRm78]